MFDEYQYEQENTEKKGVKKPKWTRIMTQNGYFQNSIAIFPLEDDLKRVYEDLTDQDSLSSGDDDCLFDPQ